MKFRKIIRIFYLGIIGISLYYCKPEEIILHGDLTGLVTDAETNQPIAAVIVKLNPSDNSTNTDRDGKYMFENLTPEIYEIEASKYSYGTISKTAAILQGRTQ
jgi:hypothetical protein